MRIEGLALEQLDEHCARVLELTPHARDLIADPSRAREARDEFAAIGFATVRDVIPRDAWIGLVTIVLPILRRVAEEVTLIQQPISLERLSDGARFRRVDPHCLRNPATREKMSLLLEKLGLSPLGASLAAALTPLIRGVVGPVSFSRTYFYLYEEGDYISAHNDHHVGDRVDVQFPVSLGTPGGVRVLSGGFLEMRYDVAGSMNVLGPRVWHDVPPVLRSDPDVAPRRFNMGFRFTPDPAA
ncbi:hypothetical protein BE08_23970 [Sorangium cellulosum]|uniref:Fe2OG dioxygenase domain-containing protein n=1 Tax=Sorangium cellulosum TaxID=56 RepID=A0A150PD84_SORCE|nr:hypothetical protein BE08_23970 [Sorangium cellulosum]